MELSAFAGSGMERASSDAGRTNGRGSAPSTSARSAGSFGLFRGRSKFEFFQKRAFQQGKKPGISRKTEAFLTPGKEVFTIVTGKVKFALWLTPEVKEMIAEHYRMDNCVSQSEFIEKAIVFYCGYLHAVQAENYLPKLLKSTLVESLEKVTDRMGRLMFKMAVEENISHHILAADSDMDEDTYNRLRRRSVDEVRATKGEISFKDDLIFQKSV